MGTATSGGRTKIKLSRAAAWAQGAACMAERAQAVHEGHWSCLVERGQLGRVCLPPHVHPLLTCRAQGCRKVPAPRCNTRDNLPCLSQGQEKMPTAVLLMGGSCNNPECLIRSGPMSWMKTILSGSWISLILADLSVSLLSHMCASQMCL